MKIDLAVKESLTKNILLFISSSDNSAEFLEKLISTHLNNKTKMGLVSLDKSYSDISTELKAKNIDPDNILFIDCVSKKTGKAEKKGNVFYVSSPTAYTEINITIKEALKAGVQNIVFDSLSKLLIHGNHPIVYKYIQDLISFCRENNKKVFFMLHEDDANKKVAGQIQEIVDKVIILGEEGANAKADAVKLMKGLFGPNASMMIEKLGDKKPELLIKDFKEILSKLVGPENADKQLKEMYTKYS